MNRTSIVAASCGVLLVGCAMRPHALLHDPPRAESVAALIEGSPLPPGENIRSTEIGRGENMSAHLIQVGDGEKPHVHTRYDLTVIIVEGRGSLWLADAKLPMNVGDVAFIPRGTRHYFVNEGSGAAAAIVVFSPPFDGPDNE